MGVVNSSAPCQATRLTGKNAFHIKGSPTIRLEAVANVGALRALLRRHLYLYFFQISPSSSIGDQVSHFIEYIVLFCRVWSPQYLSSNAAVAAVSPFNKERMPTTAHHITRSPSCHRWGTNTWLRRRSSRKPSLVFSTSVTGLGARSPFKERV